MNKGERKECEERKIKSVLGRKRKGVGVKEKKGVGE